jgi:hypothetical protein
MKQFLMILKSEHLTNYFDLIPSQSVLTGMAFNQHA